MATVVGLFVSPGRGSGRSEPLESAALGDSVELA